MKIVNDAKAVGLLRPFDLPKGASRISVQKQG